MPVLSPREIRIAVGLTLADASRCSGFSTNTIRLYEANALSVSDDTALRLARWYRSLLAT